MVETAIILPIMISLMVGGVDFGMAFSAYATVGKSVRDAARYLGSLPPPDPNDSGTSAVACSTWAITRAKNLAVFGNLSGSGSPLISGWQTDGPTGNKVSVDCEDFHTATNCTYPDGTYAAPYPCIVVSAQAPYNTLMLGAVLPGVGTFTLSDQHAEQLVGG